MRKTPTTETNDLRFPVIRKDTLQKIKHISLKKKEK